MHTGKLITSGYQLIDKYIIQMIIITNNSKLIRIAKIQKMISKINNTDTHN